MSLENIVRDLFTTILAAIIGIFYYKRLCWFHRLLFFQTLLYLFIDLIASQIKQNGLIYNLYMPLETLLLIWAAEIELKTTSCSWLLLITYLVFILIYFAEMYFAPSLNNFAFISALTESLFISCIYTFVLYMNLNPTSSNLVNLPVTITSLSLIIYFAGSIPFIAAMGELTQISKELSKMMFGFIVVMLASIRYLMLAISYFLVSRGNIYKHY